MEPLTAIAIAKGIASATGLDNWIKDKLGEKFGDKTAQKITDIAQLVTGAESPELALQRIKDDAAASAAVKQKLIDNEHELVLAQLQDVQSARTMYAAQHEMADKIAEQVISQNHIAVVLLLIANGVVLYLISDTTIALALGNLIGASVAALWNERQQVIGFFFGSSLGSKIKSAVAVGK